MNNQKNKGWEEAPDHTGKAPRHKEVARASKLKDTLREPMGGAETQNLYKSASWHNPFVIEVGGKEYELKNIILYKRDGTEVSVGKGWFGSNNGLKEFPIPVASKRLKPKLDGATFIIPRKKEWHERHDIRPHAILYIPYEYFDFNIEVEDKGWGEGQRVKTPVHISRRFLQDEKFKTPLTVEENSKAVFYQTEEASKQKKKIEELEAQLEKERAKLRGL